MGQIYTQLLKNIILPTADISMKTKVAKHIKLIKKMNKWSKNDISDWQDEKLKKLINHAYENTVYYKNLFDNIKLKPSDIKGKDDLIKIPPLTKESIKKNFSDLIPSNIDKIYYNKKSTGGSTGEPLTYLLDNVSWSWTNANTIVNWEKTSYNYGDTFIALGSTSLLVEQKKSLKHSIYYSLKNKIGLNGINMSDSVCRDYIQLIKEKNIKYIYGYASSIYLLAKYLVNNNIKINIKACFPTSEVLTSTFRETIEKAFDCVVLNGYGANDGGITAFEHNKGFFEVSYNCIINFNNMEYNIGFPAQLTDLFNYAMPLINYQLGDELIITKECEKYNYNGQVFSKVLGRTSDLIILENGNILTGPGFTVLFGQMPVDYYNIEKIGNNSIRCSIKKRNDFNQEHETVILSSLQKHCGNNVDIKIDYSDEIKYTSSGKMKYFG